MTSPELRRYYLFRDNRITRWGSATLPLDLIALSKEGQEECELTMDIWASGQLAFRSTSHTPRHYQVSPNLWLVEHGVLITSQPDPVFQFIPDLLTDLRRRIVEDIDRKPLALRETLIDRGLVGVMQRVSETILLPQEGHSVMVSKPRNEL